MTHEFQEGRFGDDGLCHAHVAEGHPTEGRCYKRRADHHEGVPVSTPEERLAAVAAQHPDNTVSVGDIAKDIKAVLLALDVRGARIEDLSKALSDAGWQQEYDRQFGSDQRGEYLS